MERHEIEAFLTLAEELHFRRTAERLGLAHGRVSQTISKLERRIGAALFERTSRRVALTAIGERFYRDLAPVQRQLEEAVARAVASGKGITGTLAVGYSSQWCGDLVNQAAERFRRGYPDCVVQGQEVQLHDPFGRLRAGELDLQLTEFPVMEPDLVTGPVIYSDPRVLMVPARHPFAGRESLSLEDLADAEMISVAGVVPDYWLDTHFPRTTPLGRPIPHAYPVRYWQEALSLIATGKGVSVASARAELFCARPGIAFVPFRDAPPIEYGLLWPRSAETARVRAFVAVIGELAARQR